MEMRFELTFSLDEKEIEAIKKTFPGKEEIIETNINAFNECLK